MHLKQSHRLEDSNLPHRIFHRIKGKKQGPTVVFFAGIHGNEYAGVDALNSLLPKLNADDFRGEVFGIYGNIKALSQRKRFIDCDLNRVWTKEQLKGIENLKQPNSEQLEQKSLYAIIKDILNSSEGPFYFIDLHTTSSKTLPFITINDALINRRFSSCFNIPVVLGIEEYLEGPLLSYLNTLGYVSLGFEAGQHIDPLAVKNCEAFIFLVLKHSGVFEKQNIHKVKAYQQILKSSSNDINSIFEVVYKYHIKPFEDFKMLSGFKSFQPIRKGIKLALSNNQPVHSKLSGQLFMPLYQKSGNDGFFIIRKIPNIFLKLSKWLRTIKFDSVLTLSPGISWYDKPQGILKANLVVARYLTKPIFHLLGYRNKRQDKNHLLLYNRERVAKKRMYKQEKWY